MRSTFVRRTSRLLLGASLLCALPALAWQPEKNVEIVIAGGPGGGTDQLGRLIQSIITTHKLLDVNTVVLNKGGGNGAEAFLDLKMAQGDPGKLVIGTNNIYLLPLVAKLGYQWQELTPVAALAEDDFILWTYQDAPWKDAKAFYEAVKTEPKLRMGGSQSKDVDQTLTLLLNRTIGSKLTYIPFKSGSEAATQLAGKHIASNVNNPAESISQWRGNQVRPLCVFSREPMQYTDKVAGERSWSDIPTCHSQGLGIDQYRFPRTVFMPGGVSAEQRAFYVELLRKVTQAPEFKAYVSQNALVPTFLEGEPLNAYIEQDTARVTPVFKEAGWLRD
ncbi:MULTISPECIES: Bug family tripartite tricarboxylate transporter substrate binding protein [Pseudomonas]|uniref:Tricarboxylate transporter n=2 Tax=Pseudomonas TaxID=286 RepID=A0A9Q6IJU3_9PSED|nr:MULTISPECIES: tripartite tricarboxylate transporter substrate binding protein [Pseudomonas]MBW8354276.1 tripartite tricarboxylate transporter substrate binding protein [Pseudomonas sp.]MCO7575803.1 tripartite tricarboxylate transporter substrate binding protein [Pseudomonas protegens]MCO7581359.1 tripartite tricarboxylate transporter substrate binding protein [Pseudomonas chlororaphis]MCO7597616.1 tripartite tricarboxylate transporter substrate binding protein [Pseudomonas chlororaphis]MDC7